jgi:competence ComEA-like helix-hairpin-helix protein
MVARGAQGSDEELMGVVEYLTREHGRVNVNLAATSEIELVLALTPSEAEAIVQYRRTHGTFEDAASLGRVPGIDAKKLQAKEDALIFGSRVASKAGLVPVAALTAANNWPGVSGGPQREGWARPEAMLSRSTVGQLKLLYSRTLGDRAQRLSPPLILGNLISYRGFKEMLFLAGVNDTVYSVDAVLNRVLWNTRLPVKGASAVTTETECAGGSTAIVMTGSASTAIGSAAGIRRPGALPAGVLPAAATSKNPLIIGLASGFGRNGLLLALGSDGNVHPLYQSNGATFGSPIPFLPPGTHVRSINLFDNTLYAAAVGGCGGTKAIYALDLAPDTPAGATFEIRDGARGSAGTAIGSDGVVYAHVADRVLALTPKALRPKDEFILASPPGGGITPAVFRRGSSEVVVAGGANRVVLLDTTALGGADHRVPIAHVETAGTPRGAFATWEDPDTASRWIYVPLQMSSSSGSLAAFRVEDRGGRLSMSLAWTSQEMSVPAAPVVANGLVFVLSTGGPAAGATLSILDAATGQRLFSSGSAIGRAADPETGLAVANGRVYFSTVDGTVYSFGIPSEQ